MEERLQKLIDLANVTDNVYMFNELKILRQEIKEEIETYAIN
jgi:hypothetical protein|tara:strand:- start:1354 stop:1479 length:126 start_codon:yes stop_codon:yes gene_type:complete